MKIGLDLDGVTVEFQRYAIERYNAWFDEQVDPADWTEWDSNLKLTHFTTQRQFFDWIDDIPSFWANVPPVAGALGAVHRLAAAGHTFELITSRKDSARLETIGWINKHWPLNVAVDLHHVSGSKSQVPCSVYVDDDPKVLEDLTSRNLQTFRFVRPCNEGAPGFPVDSWSQLVTKIEEIAAEDQRVEHARGAYAFHTAARS